MGGNGSARRVMEISIHAPREGGDLVERLASAPDAQFQSTPPARGATLDIAHKLVSTIKFQSTPPARGAT